MPSDVSETEYRISIKLDVPGQDEEEDESRKSFPRRLRLITQMPQLHTSYEGLVNVLYFRERDAIMLDLIVNFRENVVLQKTDTASNQPSCSSQSNIPQNTPTFPQTST